MRWQQRVRVATGLSCWQIVLHLLVVALLVMGWMSGTLVRVGTGLCVVYGVTVLLMLALQRHHEQRWRDVADVLEELTTTWYFGAAMIVLWLLSRVLQNNVLLALAGLVIWPDPPWSRCWRKTKATSPYVETSHTPLSRLWPLSPTAATNFPRQSADSHPSGKSVS